MSDFPKHQVTITWSYSKNGVMVSENHCHRTDDEAEYEKYRDSTLKKIVSAKSFPEDEGSTAHTASTTEGPMCKVHNQAMVWRPAGISTKTGKAYPGFFSCQVKTEDGKYCTYRPNFQDNK